MRTAKSRQQTYRGSFRIRNLIVLFSSMTNRDFLDPRATEQRQSTLRAHRRRCSLEIVDIMNGEDARVAGVVHGQREQIAQAIDLIVGVFKDLAGSSTSAPHVRPPGRARRHRMPTHLRGPATMVTGVIAGGYGALVKSAEGAEDDVNAGAAAMDTAP